MNKDEIKKALVLCQMSAVSTCRDCPYIENCDGTQLYKDALDLITEQENEIERLKEEKKQAQIDVLNDVKDVLANQKHECLERNNLVGYSAIAVCEKYIDVIINEVENDK